MGLNLGESLIVMQSGKFNKFTEEPLLIFKKIFFQTIYLFKITNIY